MHIASNAKEYYNRYMNDDQLKQVFVYMDGQFAGMRDSMERHEAKTDAMNVRLGNLESRFGKLESKVEDLRHDMNERFDTVEQVQNEILNAIDERFKESDAHHDARHDKNERHIKQLAKHTGLKLAA